MRQPRSADCSNKERRRSISVLLYLLLLFVIIPSNYGVFSFASFSEASTAVVFIAKLVDLIMETPIELHYKSKLFLLLLFWKITCNLIRVGWGIGILWSQSLIYLFVTLQLWSSGSELLAEFIWVFVFVHFLLKLIKIFSLEWSFERLHSKDENEARYLEFSFRVNGNLRFLTKKRVHCFLFNMICIIFKLVTCNFFNRGCQHIWTTFNQFGDGRSKQWKRNGESKFQIDWKTSLCGLSLPYLYGINDWGYHGFKNSCRVNIISFFLYIAFVFFIFILRCRKVHLPWVSLSLHIRTTIIIIIIIFGLE